MEFQVFVPEDGTVSNQSNPFPAIMVLEGMKTTTTDIPDEMRKLIAVQPSSMIPVAETSLFY